MGRRCTGSASYCNCRYHKNLRESPNDDNAGFSGSFSDTSAVVDEGNTGRADRLDVYYGGEGRPDGPGHGHVVTNDGENVSYWREPGSSTPFIDDHQ